jgi:transposase-like protein
MAGSKRSQHGVRRGRAGWSAAVAAWRESGLSAAEFCRRHGLVQSTFQWWRWRLGREATPGVAAVPALVAVRVVGSPADGGGSPAEPAAAVLELVLPSGVRLRVPAGFDERTVAGVLWALGAVGPC